MRRRIFTSLTLISLLLWVATMGVVGLARFGHVDPTWGGDCISLTPGCHISVLGDFHDLGAVGAVAVYSDKSYGPYRGSMIDVNGHTVVRGFGAPGIYWRHFRPPQGGHFWTLVVSLWYPLILFAILPAAWLIHRRRRRRLARLGGEDPCPNCGYDCRASTEQCPECGHTRGELG